MHTILIVKSGFSHFLGLNLMIKKVRLTAINSSFHIYNVFDKCHVCILGDDVVSCSMTSRANSTNCRATKYMFRAVYMDMIPNLTNMQVLYALDEPTF